MTAEVNKLPLISVNAVVHAGAARDPLGKEGIASLGALLVAEGAAGLDGAALTERFELLGTGLDSGADWDATILRLTVTPPRLEEALELLAEVMRAPALPGNELERLRSERLAELLQQRSEPRGLADEMFSTMLYAPSARYAKPEAGDDASVRAITLADVRSWHSRTFRPEDITLVAAGDISGDRFRALAERVFGDWRSSENATAEPSGIDAPASDGARAWLIPRDEAAQSELRIGHVGLARSHPDFFPAAVMNAVLGGLFSSRINLNLREEHGYTYGAFSGFDWRLGAGPFIVSSAVQSEHTVDAAREVLSEIERIRESEISESELSLASAFLQGVFPIRYETTSAIASALTNLAIYGLPDDYFDTYRDRIAAVDTNAIRRAAESHLRPSELRMVVVGRRDLVEPGMETLGIGPPRVVRAGDTGTNGEEREQ
jgi:zinc protease